MNTNSIDKKRNIVWSFLKQYSSYAIKVLVQVILARLLLPSDFGVIAIVLAVISLAETISASGLGTALIQKNDAEIKDYATVLTASLVFSSVIYLLLFLFAPLISSYYDNQILTPILRVYGIAIFIQSYASVQSAFVIKKFKFKQIFLATLFSTLISGTISIVLAIKGFGLWALVVQGLLSSIFIVILLHILVPWVPHIGFDKTRFKSLFSFSWKVLLSSLTGKILEESYNLTIGKIYGEDVLGYYKQGNSYAGAVLGQARSALESVMFPIYTSLQNDSDSLKLEIKKMTNLSTFIVFPMAFGLAAISKTFISVILTDKWLPCLLFLRLECIFYGTLPIASSLGNAMTAIGRSDVSLKIEITKLVLTIVCILCLHNASVELLCIVRVIIALAVTICSSFISGKLLNYGFFELIKDIYKPFLFSLIMGSSCFLVSFLDINYVLILIIQVLAGILIYLVLSLLFMRDSLFEIKNIFIKKKYEEQTESIE
ncbi:MAG: lipopolysaccharide biosynthesis protein [Bacilli bacterium]|nr:lipopolysaccharide biosynthesis protein [Bacilli bacterium]